MNIEELKQIYDLCIDELARYTLAGVKVAPTLLHIIAKLEKDIRDKTILEKMELINQKGPNIDLHSILEKNYLKPISNNYEYFKYNKNLYYNLLSKNTLVADSIQPKAARLSFESSQYIEEDFSKMTSPMAAEVTQDAAAQPDYFGESRPR